jgi:hypothetical protein
MATLREIIYDVRELVNAYSDDSNLSDEHIAFMAVNYRNLLSKQQMSNLKRTVPKEALQVICLKLEKDEQCFDEIDVLKSSFAVPATLDNTGRSDLHRVHAPGSRFVKNINIVDYARMPYLSAEKYNGSQLYISVDHLSHLIVYNSEGKHLMLEELQIEGAFENPEEAYNLSCNKEEGVDFWDTQFPIDASLVAPLKTQILQEILYKFKVPTDKINDGEDASPQQSPANAS